MKLSVTLHQKINLFIFLNIILFNIEINAGITDFKILNEFESKCFKGLHEANKVKKKYDVSELKIVCECMRIKLENSRYTNDDYLNNSPQHKKETENYGAKWGEECMVENNLNK